MNDAIVIVGAGPAGVRAAEVLAGAGLRPIVIDEGLRGGGQIYRRAPASIKRDCASIYGFEAGKAQSLHETLDGLGDRIDFRPRSMVWNVGPLGIEIVGPGGMETIQADKLIIASGAMDRIIPIPGWTRPGVFTLGGAQVALKFQASHIGRRPVFLGTGPLLYLVAYQYMKTGARVAAVLDTAPLGNKLLAVPGMLSGGRVFAKGLFYMARLMAAGVPVHFGVSPVAIEGGDGVSSLSWNDSRGHRRQTAADSVALGFGLISETQLADVCEVEFAYDSMRRQWLPCQDAWGRSSRDGTYLAGDGAGIAGADLAELSGKRAALALLHDMGIGDRAGEIGNINRRIRRSEWFRDTMERKVFAFPEGLARGSADDLMICRCEGIMAGQIRAAATDFGVDEINRAKAISRVGMGRCQGRVCRTAAAEILADATGQSVESVGRLRGQAPVKPVSMRDLAESARP